ncbi:MAG: RNase adapter RapZ [Rhodocyclaceae bacterium]|nr:RNase adapter RapZ [Rhodocyclaceae bacterium]
MQLVLISGLSGSGKSIALNVLEDAGFFCVDNLPATLLPQLVSQLRNESCGRAAVAMDMRGGATIAALPMQLRDLQADGDVDLSFIFLDARDEVLIQRFSETRRRHPLAAGDITLAEAIRGERDALETLAGLGHRIDTSNLRPNALRAFIKDFVQLAEKAGFTLLFESFGFKHGLPLDADLVFDVRCLPNPHYDPALRSLTGLDGEVIAFLEAQPEAGRMLGDIGDFVERWLPAYLRDNRSYLTVAVGCTGGQHRSVYFAERLAARFSSDITPASGHESSLKLRFRDGMRVLVRHRNL